MIDQAVGELVSLVGAKAAGCGGGPTSGHPPPAPPPPPRRDRVQAPQPPALSAVEPKQVLGILHDPEHVDEAPASVYAKLLDQGV